MKPHDILHGLAAAENALSPGMPGITPQVFDALYTARHLCNAMPEVLAALEWCERVHMSGKAQTALQTLRTMLADGEAAS